MKPDLLITWIKHTDYPTFRYFLKKRRDFFGEVIVYFSEHNRFPYFDHFMHEAMKDHGVTFLDPAKTDWGIEDWRNKSTNHMLNFSDSEWVCSVEQDYFARDWDKLLALTEEACKDCDLFGHPAKPGSRPSQDYLVGEYIHPAFWFMKREALERTTRNFSAVPEKGWDHFGLITEEAMAQGMKVVTLADLGLQVEVGEQADAFHLGGVCQNYLECGNPDYVFHRPVPFFVYNYWARRMPVAQSPDFTSLSMEVEGILRVKHGVALDPENNEWNRFFKV